MSVWRIPDYYIRLDYSTTAVISFSEPRGNHAASSAAYLCLLRLDYSSSCRESQSVYLLSLAHIYLAWRTKPPNYPSNYSTRVPAFRIFESERTILDFHNIVRFSPCGRWSTATTGGNDGTTCALSLRLTISVCLSPTAYRQQPRLRTSIYDYFFRAYSYCCCVQLGLRTCSKE